MKKLLVIFCLLFLSACGTKIEYVTITEKEPILVPESFYVKQEIPPPLSEQKYLSLSEKERERALASYINKLLSTIKDYSLVIDHLFKYNQEQSEIVRSVNKEK